MLFCIKIHDLLGSLPLFWLAFGVLNIGISVNFIHIKKIANNSLITQTYFTKKIKLQFIWDNAVMPNTIFSCCSMYISSLTFLNVYHKSLIHDLFWSVFYWKANIGIYCPLEQSVSCCDSNFWYAAIHKTFQCICPSSSSQFWNLSHIRCSNTNDICISMRRQTNEEENIISKIM